MRGSLIGIMLFLSAVAVFGQSDNRPRIYIEESNSWEVKGDPIFSSTDKKGRVSISGGE